MSAALAIILVLMLPSPLALQLRGPLVVLVAPPAPNEPATDDTFAMLDADGSGTVTREEFEAWFEPEDPADDPFAFFDANGDGVITPAELAPMTFETFEERDT